MRTLEQNFYAESPIIPHHLRRGRASTTNRSGRFEKFEKLPFYDGWEQQARDDSHENKLELFKEYPKTIISKNDSPDIPFETSINPYRGCSHGCIYCFARPSHNYMGLSAGLDFERKIFAKENAAALLEQEITKPGYKVKTIAMGTNTDPYQQVEKDLKITRSIIEVLNKHNHPLTILTKSKLIVRDIDLLSEMASKGLVKASLSVTTLDPRLSRVMEPRASSPQRRLDAIRLLSQAGIPTGGMFAPVIPGINDEELERVLQALKHAGAEHAGYILLRLPMEVKYLFEEWLDENFPDRKSKVLNRLYAMRGGKANDPRFGNRMKGSGFEAEMLSRRFHVHARRFHLKTYKSNPDVFMTASMRKVENEHKGQQLNLF